MISIWLKTGDTIASVISLYKFLSFKPDVYNLPESEFSPIRQTLALLVVGNCLHFTYISNYSFVKI